MDCVGTAQVSNHGRGERGWQYPEWGKGCMQRTPVRKAVSLGGLVRVILELEPKRFHCVCTWLQGMMLVGGQLTMQQ